MRLPFFRRRPPESKASRTGALIALSQSGRAVWTPRDYAGLAREGCMGNAVVHRCVRLVAEAVASVPLLLREGSRERDTHPLLALLERPNPRQGRAAFLEAVVGHLMVAGNAYLEAVGIDGTVRELHALRPDRMRVVPGPDGWPQAYDYALAGRTVRLSQAAEPVPSVLHIAFFHPLDDHYGLAPLESAQAALETHNSAAAWNKALLDNAARPSGALVYQGPDGAMLGEDQFRRLKDELAGAFQGARNAGRPLLLDGGLDWKSMAHSPAEMDFVEMRNAAAREIALALGVPPMLLGLHGGTTYSNYQEANRALWRQTVIPLLSRILDETTRWLAPAFPGEALRLEPDLDRIEALSVEREALWRRVTAAGFLSEEEKRAAVGYGAR